MNIIVGQDKSVRLTQYSSQSTYNIEDIKFYIAKALHYSDIYIKLVKYRNTYPFVLMQSGETVNYNIFSVAFTQPVSLSAREYDFVLSIDNKDIELTPVNLNEIKVTETSYSLMTLELAPIAEDPLVTEWGLTDMHEPIDIIDKEIMIGNNQNVLVAEDNISQGISFRMLRNYDGIDLSSKNIYAEYIPVGSEVIFRDLIKTGNINFAPDKPSNSNNEEDYISILWEVTVNTTKQPGIVPFAICAEDAENMLTSNDQGISRQYVWQTLPSQIIIQKNLGRRESSIAEPNGQTLSEQLLMHMDNTFVKFNKDTPKDPDDDVLTSGSDETEIVLDGGGAPKS